MPLRTFVAAIVLLFVALPARAGDYTFEQATRITALGLDPQEVRCLALNDYFEARNETLDGRIAVAQTVLNRVASRHFPGTVCGVVTENRLPDRMHACQFSWYCDGKSDVPKNKAAWRRSVALALLMLTDPDLKDRAGGALWYHARYVKPDWAENYQVAALHKRHIFYRFHGGSVQLAYNYDVRRR